MLEHRSFLNKSSSELFVLIILGFVLNPNIKKAKEEIKIKWKLEKTTLFSVHADVPLPPNAVK